MLATSPAPVPNVRHDDRTARFVDDRDNLNLGAGEAAMQANDTAVDRTLLLRGKTYNVRRFYDFWEFQLVGTDGWTVASPELAKLIDERLGQHDDGELNGSIAAPMSNIAQLRH